MNNFPGHKHAVKHKPLGVARTVFCCGRRGWGERAIRVVSLFSAAR